MDNAVPITRTSTCRYQETLAQTRDAGPFRGGGRATLSRHECFWVFFAVLMSCSIPPETGTTGLGG
jgi:hypothetical protein